MGDDLITLDTELTDIAPALIESDAIANAEKLRVFRPLIGARGIRDLTGTGQSSSVPQVPAITLASTTEATNDTAMAYNPTVRTFTPVTYGGTIVVSWEGDEASAPDVKAMIAESAAAAFVAREDEDTTVGFCTLYSEPSAANDIGADGVNLSAANIRTVQKVLSDAGAHRPYNCVLDPGQVMQLFADSDAKQYMMNTKAGAMVYAATTGVAMDRFVGEIYGVYIWQASSMMTSTGFHGLAFGQNALGIGYKRIATPESPTLSELNLDIGWDRRSRAWECVITCSQNPTGIAFTETTNDWLVNVISEDPDE